MGMGEPLANYENTINSIKKLNSNFINKYKATDACLHENQVCERGNQIQIELCSLVTVAAPDLLDENIRAGCLFNNFYWSSN